MSDAYPCLYSDCGRIFSKASELKKHQVTHSDPDRVFHCPECSFITLQKKNLGVHVAIHTGEKIHQCPEMISVVDSSRLLAREERCEYRTNDPAALTKHRKRMHGYIPSPNRSRPRRGATATARKTRQRRDGKVSCQPLPSQCSLSISCPKPSNVAEKVNKTCNGTGYTFTSTMLPEDLSSFLWQGNVDVTGQPIDPCSANVSGFNSSIPGAALFAPEEEMDLNSLYDPSLQPEWMLKYEMGYSMFDVTGMKYHQEPFPPVPLSDTTGLDVQIDCGGRLCPDWMVEARIQDWNQTALDVNKQFYVSDA